MFKKGNIMNEKRLRVCLIKLIEITYTKDSKEEIPKMAEWSINEIIGFLELQERAQRHNVESLTRENGYLRGVLES